jgi:glucokinase
MVKKYMNENYHSFSDIVKEFFLTAGITKPPITACIAVAGPVKQNVVRFSNRDTWSIDGDMLADEFGIKFVRLINDFAANGYGLLTLGMVGISIRTEID